MNDPIDRQAAIEDIRTMIPKDARFDIKWIEMWLMQLPPAQPEIILCKDCKYLEQESICEGYCHETELDGIDEDHFCSYAERREE